MCAPCTSHSANPHSSHCACALVPALPNPGRPAHARCRAPSARGTVFPRPRSPAVPLAAPRCSPLPTAVPLLAAIPGALEGSRKPCACPGRRGEGSNPSPPRGPPSWGSNLFGIFDASIAGVPHSYPFSHPISFLAPIPHPSLPHPSTSLPP